MESNLQTPAQKASAVLFNALEVARQRGAFTFQESAQIHNAMETLKTANTPPVPTETAMKERPEPIPQPAPEPASENLQENRV